MLDSVQKNKTFDKIQYQVMKKHSIKYKQKRILS